MPRKEKSFIDNIRLYEAMWERMNELIEKGKERNLSKEEREELYGLIKEYASKRNLDKYISLFKRTAEKIVYGDIENPEDWFDKLGIDKDKAGFMVDLMKALGLDPTEPKSIYRVRDAKGHFFGHPANIKKWIDRWGNLMGYNTRTGKYALLERGYLSRVEGKM